MPAFSRRKASESRTASSSSMTCTKVSFRIASLFSADGAKRQTEDRASARIGLHPELAAMRLNDGARNGKPHSHTLPLCRYEGLEQLLGDFRRNARPGVGDADLDHAIPDCL